MYKYFVSKKFKFDAAHKLSHLNYESKCRNFHGHSYTVEIRLFSNILNDYRMVLDFNDFKPFKTYIDDTFDHSVLCTIENYADHSNCGRVCVIPNSTTSEDIAEFLCNKFFELILQNRHFHIEKIEVLVSETENNKASFSRILT